MNSPNPSNERRLYLRLDSVFPVQFKIISPDGKIFYSEWIQGFTHNISKGGIRLDVNNLKPETISLLRNGQTAVFLQIQMPLTRPMVNAQAKIAWVRESEDGDSCSLGLDYEQINSVGEKRIMRYVWAKIMFLPAVITVILVLGLGFGINGYVNLKLFRGNRALVEQLIKILQDSNVAKQKIKEISRDKESLQLKIDALQLRIDAVETEKSGFAEKAKAEEAKSASSVKELNSVIEKLSLEKNSLQEQLIGLQHKESAVTDQLLDLNQKKGALEKANIDKMYQWLAVHQNRRTGLVMSFEGDSEVANWAFIYDQSLALQVYCNFSDFERAKAILEFFSRKAKKVDGFFVNAYYADDGSPAEYTVRSGPNIWLGIAACQYTQKTGDNKYIRLAEEIAQNIMNLQAQDKDGGLRGGLTVEWYSTEHNLDSYAFFNMLYRVTGKQLYQEARDKTLSWLVSHTYDKASIPVKRGKGDSTIATDTYAWSIAAIGPERLSELGMNPDKIMEFAGENCAVEAYFSRPDGQRVKVRGFDFAAKNHIARGGVVSAEWTAQMIMAYKIMGEYYHKKGMANKASSYEEKADEYMNELCNMIISSPSPSGQGAGCLPYASLDFVDTGHGWMTPKGKATGSVSATAYALFAYHNYNPLQLKE
jgi:hypothetical protein